MKNLLIKLFIPHESNDYHPHSTRHHSIFSYAAVFLILNFILMPILGIKKGEAKAASLTAGELIQMANNERQNLGLVKLNTNSLLTNAAYAKANDMFQKQYWNHYGPNGETPWQFINGAGYDHLSAGENLGKDFSNSADLHNAWMNSPTHRANIVKSEFRDIGIAVVSGTFQGSQTTIVVQMFGVTKNAPPVPTATPKPTSAPVVNTPIPTKTPVVSTPKPTAPRATFMPSPTPEILTPPVLTNDPNQITNNKIYYLEGNSVNGNTVKVFQNEEMIGELPIEGGVFSNSIELKEGQNDFYAVARNTTTSTESVPSNKVTKVLDTNAPLESNIEIKISATEEQINVNVVSKEELANVRYSNLDLNGELVKTDTKNFSIALNRSDLNSPDLTLYFIDLAGNSISKIINLKEYIPEQESETQVIAGFTASGGRGMWEAVVEMPTRQKVNLAFIFFIILFLVIDNLVLIRKGLKREIASRHSYSLSVIMIILLGAVTQFV